MIKKSQKVMSRKSPYQQRKNTAEAHHLEFSKKNTLRSLLVVFCLPVLLYLQTITYSFTNFDDDFMIQNNIPFLQDFHNVSKAFSTDQFLVKSSSFYRPLGTLSYMVDIQLSGGNNAWMYHLSNILLLGLIACSLFLLLRRFLIPHKLALFGTLIYCMHPLFVSATAHIPNRAELLLILFAFMSFLFFIEFLQKKKWKYLILHWISFTLALFCKETAAFLPFLFIIYYFTFIEKKYFEKTHLIIIALYLISGLFWFWMRSIALKGVPDLGGAFGLMPLLTNLRTIPESLATFFIPFGIAAIPGFTVVKTLAGLVILFILFYFLFKNKSRNKWLFGFLWFFILIIPSMLYKHPDFDYLNHRFFLPLVGILLWLLFIFPEKWIEKGRVKNSWFFIAVLVIFSSVTVVKSRSYSDPMTFYTSAISQNPRCAMAYNNRGVLYEHQEQFDKAIADYSKAVELKPDDSKAYFNRGVLYFRKGLYDIALSDYTNAIKSKPDYTEAYLNRGNLYGQKKLFNKAIADYSKAIELKPDFAMAYNNRGTLYSNEGNTDKALADYTKAIDLDPDFTEAYHNRGMVYGNQGLYDKAIRDFTKAIDLKPNDAENYNNRGIVYKAEGLLDKSCQDFKRASELGSEKAKK
jgi:Tfp pilus assembly protein PilF